MITPLKNILLMAVMFHSEGISIAQISDDGFWNTDDIRCYEFIWEPEHDINVNSRNICTTQEGTFFSGFRINCTHKKCGNFKILYLPEFGCSDNFILNPNQIQPIYGYDNYPDLVRSPECGAPANTNFTLFLRDAAEEFLWEEVKRLQPYPLHVPEEYVIRYDFKCSRKHGIIYRPESAGIFPECGTQKSTYKRATDFACRLLNVSTRYISQLTLSLPVECDCRDQIGYIDDDDSVFNETLALFPENIPEHARNQFLNDAINSIQESELKCPAPERDQNEDPDSEGNSEESEQSTESDLGSSGSDLGGGALGSGTEVNAATNVGPTTFSAPGLIGPIAMSDGFKAIEIYSSSGDNTAFENATLELHTPQFQDRRETPQRNWHFPLPKIATRTIDGISPGDIHWSGWLWIYENTPSPSFSRFEAAVTKEVLQELNRKVYRMHVGKEGCVLRDLQGPLRVSLLQWTPDGPFLQTYQLQCKTNPRPDLKSRITDPAYELLQVYLEPISDAQNTTGKIAPVAPDSVAQALHRKNARRSGAFRKRSPSLGEFSSTFGKNTRSLALSYEKELLLPQSPIRPTPKLSITRSLAQGEGGIAWRAADFTCHSYVYQKSDVPLPINTNLCTSEDTVFRGFVSLECRHDLCGEVSVAYLTDFSCATGAIDRLPPNGTVLAPARFQSFLHEDPQFSFGQSNSGDANTPPIPNGCSTLGFQHALANQELTNHFWPELLRLSHGKLAIPKKDIFYMDLACSGDTQELPVPTMDLNECTQSTSYNRSFEFACGVTYRNFQGQANPTAQVGNGSNAFRFSHAVDCDCSSRLGSLEFGSPSTAAITDFFQNVPSELPKHLQETLYATFQDSFPDASYRCSDPRTAHSDKGEEQNLDGKDSESEYSEDGEMASSDTDSSNTDSPRSGPTNGTSSRSYPVGDALTNSAQGYGSLGPVPLGKSWYATTIHTESNTGNVAPLRTQKVISGEGMRWSAWLLEKKPDSPHSFSELEQVVFQALQAEVTRPVYRVYLDEKGCHWMGLEGPVLINVKRGKAYLTYEPRCETAEIKKPPRNHKGEVLGSYYQRGYALVGLKLVPAL